MKTEHTIGQNKPTSNGDQLSVLKDKFPQCFDHDGKFILSRFQEVLNANNIEASQESYKLDWLGKSYARLLANESIRTLLSADHHHNSKIENQDSQNLLIQGDNLEVLKHLKGAYREAVKMIYIDPPYNTGSDGFVYQDDRKFNPHQLADLANVSLEEAQRILNFTQSNANSHSAWLTFMYPRLYVAKNLLQDDGVIFISIDDNEQAQLKLLCDEVFGEGNFVGELTWEKKKKGTFLSNHLTNIKESIYVFAKNKSVFQGLIGEINSEETTYPCINASNSRSVRVFPKGLHSKYRESNYELSKGSVISVTTMELNLLSDLVIKNNILAEDLVIEGNWRYKQEMINDYALKGELYITQDLYIRRIVKEDRFKTIKDLLTRVGTNPELKYNYLNTKNLFEDGWGSNEDGEEELRVLLGGKKLFSNPKPVKLITKLIASTRSESSLILDFFAGSGTTAHAVMHLNAEDGTNHQFICVQLPESLDDTRKKLKDNEEAIAFCDSLGVDRTVYEITKARIEKAAKKIEIEKPDYEGDLGFKIFKTVPLFENYQTPMKQLDTTLPLFDGQQLNNQDLADLLLTWQLKDRIALTQALHLVDLDGYGAQWFTDTMYLMHQGFESKHLKAFIEKLDQDTAFNITKIIMFGYNISSKMQREIDEGLKNYKNKKSITLDVVVRY